MGVAKLDKVKNASLPSDARFHEITGGNHGYFGSYGMQKGDNEATVSNEEQINAAANVTIEFIEETKQN